MSTIGSDEVAPSPAAAYWVQKLAPFRQAPPPFHAHRKGRDGSTGVLTITVPTPPGFDGHVADYLAALSLLLGRYGAGEEVLIAGPGPIFYRCPAHDDGTAGQLLASVRANIEASARHAGDVLDGLLAVEASGDSIAEFFRIGFISADDVRGPAGFLHLPSLLLTAGEAGRGGDARLSFDARTFPPDFADQFARHYGRTLAFLAGDSDRALDDLDLMDEAERSRVLREFNHTEQPRPVGATIHGLLEAQAAISPDATAIVFEGDCATYRALNESANRLAWYLRDHLGIRTGDAIGVVMRRSASMVTALMGVMKAGAMYVPIDPKLPGESIRQMVEDARIGMLLVNSDTAAVAANFGGQLFIMDIEVDGLTTPVVDPGVSLDADALAYVIYTSGSTGRPKGVALAHRAVVNTISWRNDYYGVDATDVNLQMPSYAFDSSVVDIFGFLAAGARLVIPDEDLRVDPRYLRDLIETHGVTRLLVTSSFYKLLVGKLAGVSGLRSVTVAGEATLPTLVAEHFQGLPGVRLVNEYGPTENAICSTACDLRDGEPTVPIGRPIWNVRAFVLDDRRRPVPIGGFGELYLAGAGLAQGYLGRPDLTAERFVACTLTESPGLMYRTGDRACWRSDGVLEFLGRTDRQVKVRGFRIELGAIEDVLLKHAAVDDCAVLRKTDRSGNAYIAAYVAAGPSIDAGTLSGYVRRLLPQYMNPDVVVILPELPLSSNGKVDLGRLRVVDDFGSAPEGPAEPLPSRFGRALLRLCESMFKRPGLGPDENFFAVGANSLRVMELVTRVRDELNARIDLLDVYSYPTVRDLSLQLEDRQSAAFEKA